jgi:hypothetical protein
MFLPNL